MSVKKESRWLVYLLEWKQVDEDEWNESMVGKTSFHRSLADARTAVQKRLNSYCGQNHVQGYIGREEWDEFWSCWDRPNGRYDEIVLMMQNDQIVCLNKGVGV